ncbi:MAG: HAMP domain-containing protein [Sideroxydans sp.]|nr:HAMP domain-containing protein [Sideroxydans sp.]
MKNLTLQNQLRLMNALSLAGMLLVILFAVINLSHLRKEFDAYQSKQAMDKNLIEIKATALSISRADPILAETETQLKATDKEIQEWQAQILGLTSDAAFHDKMAAISKHWAGYVKGFQGAIKIASTSPSDALQIPDSLYSMHLEPMVHDLDALVASNKQTEIASRARIASAVNSILWVVLLPLALVGGLVTVFQTLFSQSLRKRIGDIAAEVNHLHEGDLSRRLPASKKDEIGQMAAAINGFIARFENILRDVHESADQTQKTAHGISDMTHSVTSNAKIQSDKVLQVSAAIGQMGYTIKEIATNTASASNAANETMSLARTGSETGALTISALRRIDDTVSLSARTLSDLDAAIQRIGTVSNMIKNIAEQTNLLALNAAIEAARAGDHGRGFAVVADEVRKLSERTTASTADITKIVETIQTSTAEASQAMMLAKEEVVRGVSHGEDMGKLVRKIEDSVRIVTKMMNQIATATEEQSSAGDHITRNIDSVATISASTAADIEHSRNAMLQLADTSKALHAAVSQFKLAQAV